MEKTVKIVAHSGGFHPDDIFAVASLLLFLQEKPVRVKVVRSRNPEEIKDADYVVDVGSVYDESANRFDHHQENGAGERSNGVPYASFGLVWKKYGEHVCGSKTVADMIDSLLVCPIDYGDNRGLQLKEISQGVFPYTFDRMVSAFGGTYKEKDYDKDQVFFELVGLAKKILEREISQAKAIIESAPFVTKAYEDTEDKRIILLDKEYPWYDTLYKYPEPLFVVFPDDGTGNWGISAVRKGRYIYENRKNLPEVWAGKRGNDLADVSGVKDAIFCHNRLFFAVAGSKEGAVALANKAVSA